MGKNMSSIIVNRPHVKSISDNNRDIWPSSHHHVYCSCGIIQGTIYTRRWTQAYIDSHVDVLYIYAYIHPEAERSYNIYIQIEVSSSQLMVLHRVHTICDWETIAIASTCYCFFSTANISQVNSINVSNSISYIIRGAQIFCFCLGDRNNPSAWRSIQPTTNKKTSMQSRDCIYKKNKGVCFAPANNMAPKYT